jgi:hypothetical protein
LQPAHDKGGTPGTKQILDAFRFLMARLLQPVQVPRTMAMIWPASRLPARSCI